MLDSGEPALALKNNWSKGQVKSVCISSSKSLLMHEGSEENSFYDVIGNERASEERKI
jgi:hypothetical protein